MGDTAPRREGARALPGYGGSRILIDAALTGDFDTVVPALIGLGWLGGLAATAALIFRHGTHPGPHPSSPASELDSRIAGASTG